MSGWLAGSYVTVIAAGACVAFSAGCAEPGKTRVASKPGAAASAPISRVAPSSKASALASAAKGNPEASASTTPSARTPANGSVLPDAGVVRAESSEPELLAEDGTALPQTEERPQIDTNRFKRRMELLVEAIRSDQPELARAVFFPLVAYQQVKAVENPERDYRLRLMAAFARDVHGYHRSLGKAAKDIRFAGVDVPEASARFMKPGAEGNRLGYFRVLRSKLRVQDGGGKERALQITSMISWRGEWYVVHLDGFD